MWWCECLYQLLQDFGRGQNKLGDLFLTETALEKITVVLNGLYTLPRTLIGLLQSEDSRTHGLSMNGMSVHNRKTVSCGGATLRRCGF